MERNLIFIAFACILYWGLKWFFGKRNGSLSDMPNLLFFTIALASAVALIFGTDFWGSKVPGTFFERSKYSGFFYVNIFPEGQKIESYRVPAFIRASIEGETYRDDRSYSWREYRIEFVSMPSGSKIYFYNADEYLKLDKAVTLFDDNGKYWRVELTNQPARN